MPFQENWLWQATDQMVLDYLNGGEISGAVTWQTSDEFMFEYHEGHPTGNPIYIRPTGNADTSNIPKIDTKNKYAHQYASISKIANDGKLTGALSNEA